MSTTSPKQKPQPQKKKLFAPAQPRKSDRPVAKSVTKAEPKADAKVKKTSETKKQTVEAVSTSLKKKPISVIYNWTSPERIWKPKTQVWYLSSALVILLIILLAVKLEYYLFVVALVAFLVLWFIQGTMEPWHVKHQVTSEGIFTFEVFHRWDDMKYFWFSQKKEWIMLNIDFTEESRQPRISLLVNDLDEEELFAILLPHTKYGEPQEVGYNVVAQFIYGTYIPITKYIADLDQPEFTKTSD